MEAECPPPTYKNPTTKLYNAIGNLDDLIENDIKDENDIRALRAMVKSLRVIWAKMVTERDAKIEEAWMQYYAIWGVRNGSFSPSMV